MAPMSLLSQTALSLVRCSTRQVALLPVKLVRTRSRSALPSRASALFKERPMTAVDHLHVLQHVAAPAIDRHGGLRIGDAKVFEHQIRAGGHGVEVKRLAASISLPGCRWN